MSPTLERFIKLRRYEVKKIVSDYIRMRKMFIDHGVKDSQLEKGEGMTSNMYVQREVIIYKLKKFKSEARKFGLIGNDSFEIDDYFSDLFDRVNIKTPL